MPRLKTFSLLKTDVTRFAITNLECLHNLPAKYVLGLDPTHHSLCYEILLPSSDIRFERFPSDMLMVCNMRFSRTTIRRDDSCGRRRSARFPIIRTNRFNTNCILIRSTAILNIINSSIYWLYSRKVGLHTAKTNTTVLVGNQVVVVSSS